MKKIVIFLVTVVIIISSYTVCFAENNGIAECSVYAKYCSSNYDWNSAIIKNGRGNITTQDGNSITVILNEEYNEYTLVVRFVTEKDHEAFMWIKSMIPSDVKNFLIYDIYMMDFENNRVEIPENTMIKISGSKQKDYLLGLSCSGEKSVIKADYDGKNITFYSMQKWNYYIKCEEGGNIEVPKTGDSDDMNLWIAMLVVSLFCSIVSSRKYILNK